MGDLQGRLGAVKPNPFVGADLNLWPTICWRHRADRRKMNQKILNHQLGCHNIKVFQNGGHNSAIHLVTHGACYLVYGVDADTAELSSGPPESRSTSPSIVDRCFSYTVWASTFSSKPNKWLQPTCGVSSWIIFTVTCTLYSDVFSVLTL